MSNQIPDLAIRGENVQRLYNYYVNSRFIVNRRYQRKLVWSIEEKRAFIDSLQRGFPVPLILLAETVFSGEHCYEIIDGMQRLNAIMSFIEGEFDLNGAYFDLDTMADSKQRLDSQLLEQTLPKIDRSICVHIASYTLPLSVYRFDSPSQVDEVFRRINSNGRYLSRQELRQAGATGNFAQLVREISGRIRGDVSASNSLLLNLMRNISITNKDLPYGIKVDSIFWIEQNILTRENVRESRDEELIADIVSYMILDDPKPAASSSILDEYYDIRQPRSETSRFEDLEVAVQRITPEVITNQYLIVHEAIRSVLSETVRKFNELMLSQAGYRVPRYFQAIFLAFYELMISKNMIIDKPADIARLLDGIGRNLTIGGGGGRWSSPERKRNVSAVVGIIGSGFVERRGEDPARDSWTTQFENILTQSFTEQNLFEFKQGFHRLSPTGQFDIGTFHKVIETLTAMANNNPGSTGYVIVGIADNRETARKIEVKYGVKAKEFRKFLITGVEHEAKSYHKDLDSYFQKIVQLINSEPIPTNAKDEIGRGVRMIRYFDKCVIVFRFKTDQAIHYDQSYYVRRGANNEMVPIENYQSFFARFSSSS